LAASRQLFFGVSLTTANIDLANVNLDVKSTGMVGTSRSLYVLQANTKFGLLQDAGQRQRLGLEAAWAAGPVALQTEWVRFRYTDLRASGGAGGDADFSDWYAAGIIALGASSPGYRSGTMAPITPKRDFSPGQGGWGGLVLAVRYDRFRGDEDWIAPDAFVSVADAKAFTGAVTWLLNPWARVLADYTRTGLSDPIRVRVNPDGSADFVDEERVLTTRVQIFF
jgi:phosphate-selective porin